MKAVNYSTLLDSHDPSRVQRAASQIDISVDQVAHDQNGVQYRARNPGIRYLHEIIRLSDDAMLLSTDCPASTGQLGRQIVRDGDWLHLQFRLDGDGYESVNGSRAISTPPNSCIIARYPQDAIIERTVSGSSRWRYVCLFMRPERLTGLLDISPSSLPNNTGWLGSKEGLELHTSVLPLGPRMSLAANDLLMCAFAGSARRGFIRAKAIELVSLIIHELECVALSGDNQWQNLSGRDRAKLQLAFEMLADEDLESWTLADLARRVGLNRSKLAAGFKEVFGVTIREHWRDTHLTRTRRLLEEGTINVTDAALSMGYADAYSFTRAFQRKFGILPSDCRLV